MQEISPSIATAQSVDLLFSVVMVTYARDEMAAKSVANAAAIANGRSDIEFILVDNNPDDIDRTPLTSGFVNGRVVKMGVNKGVSARNDGARVARGEFILFLDDDAFLNPASAFEKYLDAFAGQDRLAIVTAQHRDLRTGETPREAFPHTDKSLPKDKPLKTFRFQGNGFCMRRTCFEQIGEMSSDFFYGLEEIDYAYRVIDAGWEILYTPHVWVVEHNDPGGRLPARRVQEMRLTNKMIITYKYLPWYFVPFNIVLFSAYVFYLNRGRINVFRSFWEFATWVTKNPGRRKPIGRVARDYIKACGGSIWK